MVAGSATQFSKKEKEDAHHHQATEHDDTVPEQDASWHGAGYWRWSSEDCSGDTQWYNPDGWHEVGASWHGAGYWRWSSEDTQWYNPDGGHEVGGYSAPNSVHFTVVDKSQNLFTDGTVLYRMVAVPWSVCSEAPSSSSLAAEAAAQLEEFSGASWTKDLPVFQIKAAYVDCPAPPTLESGKKAQYPMKLQGFHLEFGAFKRYLEDHKDHGKAQVHGDQNWSALTFTVLRHTLTRKITGLIGWVNDTPGPQPHVGHDQDLAHVGDTHGAGHHSNRSRRHSCVRGFVGDWSIRERVHVTDDEIGIYLVPKRFGRGRCVLQLADGPGADLL